MTSRIASFARLASIALVSASLMAGSAQAASNGTLGATSTGSITITASVASRVDITNLSDLTFAAVDPSTTATQAENVCVWSNTQTKGYTITATGSGSSGAFTLASTGHTAAPYSVQWAQTTGQTSGTALTAGTPLVGQTSAAVLPGCSAAPATSASLVVSLASTDMLNMTAGASYTGTLTLLVAPQ